MRGPSRIGLAVGLAIIVGTSAVVLAQEGFSYQLRDFGIIPCPAEYQVLLRMPPVYYELKLTEAQKRAHDAIMERHFEKIQKARRETADSEKSRQARRKAAEVARFSAVLQEEQQKIEAREKGEEPNRERPVEKIEKPRPDSGATDISDFDTVRDAIFKETQAAVRGNLGPKQRERLDEIQLQAQGPLAFSLPDSPFRAFVQTHAELRMSEDQLRRVRAIVDEGDKEIDKVSKFPISRNPNDGPLTVDAVRVLVATPEFQAAKAKSRQATREARDAVMRQIDRVLTEPQRATYCAHARPAVRSVEARRRGGAVRIRARRRDPGG